MLHGRLLAGLAAGAVERAHGDPALRLARLTIDLTRAAPMEPVEIHTARVRDGRRVRTADVRIVSNNVEVARAAALLLRTGEEPEGVVWSAPEWDVPGPDEVPPMPGRDEAIAAGHPDMRSITGPLDGPGQTRVWMRDARPLIDGEPLSPSVRAAMAADVTNPIANFGDTGLHFINADVTVTMVRLPSSEWVGLEVIDRLGADGIALGECALHDLTGRFGHAVVCSVTTTPFVR
jgi:hypothetical protein